MNHTRRLTYLVIIGLLTLFSTHQFIDIITRFRFLLVNIMNNLTSSVVVYMYFVLLISLTGYVAFFYNLKLLKNKANPNPDLLDDSALEQPKRFDWMHYGYLFFSSLVIGLSVFLIVKPLQESYPIANLPNGILPYLIVLLINGLGLYLLFDGIRLKRS